MAEDYRKLLVQGLNDNYTDLTSEVQNTLAKIIKSGDVHSIDAQSLDIIKPFYEANLMPDSIKEMTDMLMSSFNKGIITLGQSQQSNKTSFEQVISNATIGFYDALDKWVPGKSNFQTYAVSKMFGSVKSEGRSRSNSNISSGIPDENLPGRDDEQGVHNELLRDVLTQVEQVNSGSLTPSRQLIAGLTTFITEVNGTPPIGDYKNWMPSVPGLINANPDHTISPTLNASVKPSLSPLRQSTRAMMPGSAANPQRQQASAPNIPPWYQKLTNDVQSGHKAPIETSLWIPKKGQLVSPDGRLNNRATTKPGMLQASMHSGQVEMFSNLPQNMGDPTYKRTYGDIARWYKVQTGKSIVGNPGFISESAGILKAQTTRGTRSYNGLGRIPTRSFVPAYVSKSPRSLGAVRGENLVGKTGMNQHVETQANIKRGLLGEGGLRALGPTIANYTELVHQRTLANKEAYASRPTDGNMWGDPGLHMVAEHAQAAVDNSVGGSPEFQRLLKDLKNAETSRSGAETLQYADDRAVIGNNLSDFEDKLFQAPVSAIDLSPADIHQEVSDAREVGGNYFETVHGNAVSMLRSQVQSHSDGSYVTKYALANAASEAGVEARDGSTSTPVRRFEPGEESSEVEAMPAGRGARVAQNRLMDTIEGSITGGEARIGAIATDRYYQKSLNEKIAFNRSQSREAIHSRSVIHPLTQGPRQQNLNRSDFRRRERHIAQELSIKNGTEREYSTTWNSSYTPTSEQEAAAAQGNREIDERADTRLLPGNKSDSVRLVGDQVPGDLFETDLGNLEAAQMDQFKLEKIDAARMRDGEFVSFSDTVRNIDKNLSDKYGVQQKQMVYDLAAGGNLGTGWYARHAKYKGKSAKETVAYMKEKSYAEEYKDVTAIRRGDEGHNLDQLSTESLVSSVRQAHSEERVIQAAKYKEEVAAKRKADYSSPGKRKQKDNPFAFPDSARSLFPKGTKFTFNQKAPTGFSRLAGGVQVLNWNEKELRGIHQNALAGNDLVSEVDGVAPVPAEYLKSADDVRIHAIAHEADHAGKNRASSIAGSENRANEAGMNAIDATRKDKGFKPLSREVSAPRNGKRDGSAAPGSFEALTGGVFTGIGTDGENLVNAFDASGGAVLDNHAREVAREHGIEVTDQTSVGDIVTQLKAKQTAYAQRTDEPANVSGGASNASDTLAGVNNPIPVSNNDHPGRTVRAGSTPGASPTPASDPYANMDSIIDDETKAAFAPAPPSKRPAVQQGGNAPRVDTWGSDRDNPRDKPAGYNRAIDNMPGMTVTKKTDGGYLIEYKEPVEQAVGVGDKAPNWYWDGDNANATSGPNANATSGPDTGGKPSDFDGEFDPEGTNEYFSKSFFASRASAGGNNGRAQSAVNDPNALSLKDVLGSNYSRVSPANLAYRSHEIFGRFHATSTNASGVAQEGVFADHETGQVNIDEGMVRRGVDMFHQAGQEAMDMGGLDGRNASEIASTLSKRTLDIFLDKVNKYADSVKSSNDPNAHSSAEAIKSQLGFIGATLNNDTDKANSMYLGGGGRDVKYAASRQKSAQDLQMSMDQNPALKERIERDYGNAENAMKSGYGTIVAGDQAYAIGAQTSSSGNYGYNGGNGVNGGGSKWANNLRNTDFGRLMGAMYMGKQAWAMTGGDLLTQADQYAKSQQAYIGMANYGSGQASGTMMAAAYQEQGKQFTGRIAEEQFGIVNKIPYALKDMKGGETIVSGFNDLKMAAGVGMVAGVGSFMAATLGSAGALTAATAGAAAVAALPVAATVAAVVALPLLGMTAANFVTGQTTKQGWSLNSVGAGLGTAFANEQSSEFAMGNAANGSAIHRIAGSILSGVVRAGLSTTEQEQLSQDQYGMSAKEHFEQSDFGKFLGKSAANTLYGADETANQKSARLLADSIATSTGRLASEIIPGLSKSQVAFGGLDTQAKLDAAERISKNSNDQGVDDTSVLSAAGGIAEMRGMYQGTPEFMALAVQYSDAGYVGQQKMQREAAKEYQRYAQLSPYLSGGNAEAYGLSQKYDISAMAQVQPIQQAFAQVQNYGQTLTPSMADAITGSLRGITPDQGTATVTMASLMAKYNVGDTASNISAISSYIKGEDPSLATQLFGKPTRVTDSASSSSNSAANLKIDPKANIVDVNTGAFSSSNALSAGIKLDSSATIVDVNTGAFSEDIKIDPGASVIDLNTGVFSGSARSGSDTPLGSGTRSGGRSGSVAASAPAPLSKQDQERSNLIEELAKFNPYTMSDMGRQMNIGMYQTLDQNGLQSGQRDMSGFLAHVRQDVLGNDKLTGSQTLSGIGMSFAQGGESALLNGGAQGYDAWYTQEMNGLQMQSIGLQQLGLTQQKEYLWGSGSASKPSANSSWGLENQSKKLQWQSQLSNFAYSQNTMEVQHAFQLENQAASGVQMNATIGNNRWMQAFDRQTSLIQRGYAQEDYQYNTQTRSLSQGWEAEDMNEKIRRSTGYERKMLIKQRDRQTLSNNRENQQAETQNERQGEMWKREDERYAKGLAYNEQMIALELANFDRSKRQSEEMYKLEKAHLSEQIKSATALHAVQVKADAAQRAYQVKQIANSQASLAIQVTQTQKSQEYAANVKKMANEQAAWAASVQKITTYGPAVSKFLQDVLNFAMSARTSPTPSSSMYTSNGSYRYADFRQ